MQSPLYCLIIRVTKGKVCSCSIIRSLWMPSCAKRIRSQSFKKYFGLARPEQIDILSCCRPLSLFLPLSLSFCVYFLCHICEITTRVSFYCYPQGISSVPTADSICHFRTQANFRTRELFEQKKSQEHLNVFIMALSFTFWPL